MDKVSTQAIMLRKVVDRKRLKPLVLQLTKRLERFDESKLLVDHALEIRKAAAPKTLVDKAAVEKTGIEKQLEDSDEILSQLILVGNELVTNVKVANEKRELIRRNFESTKREILMSDLDAESNEAVSRLEEITSKWAELKSIKEPMGLFEELEEQKQRITDLMKQKNDIIKQCQSELSRLDEDYYIDQTRQNSDIYCLIERIDNQINLIKKTYNEHLELLQNTIDVERKKIFNEMSENWQDLYDKQSNHEKVKHETQNEKSKYYNNEIARISREQDEITRATRIRLERDAEALQLELKKVKNTVVMNSEKMDYNYQVLQKRNEENVIVSNQQKRRVNRIMETINILKKKIKETKINSELNIKNMTKEILQLQSNIMDLENKAERFRTLNEKRYNTVWEMNYKEAVDLTKKVFEIDRLLYEQQLGLDWVCPDILNIKKSDLSSFKNDVPTHSAKPRKFSKARPGQQLSQNASKTDDEKLSENLLRNILIQIANRADFLCEERLLELLEPYSESEKTLVRIDNILNVLNITNFDDVKSLKHFFLPYSWCPNCSDGISIEDIEDEFEESNAPKAAYHSDDTSIYKPQIDEQQSVITASVLQKEDITSIISERSDGCATGGTFESFTEEMDQKVDTLISKSLTSSTKLEFKHETGHLPKTIKFEDDVTKCSNHCLIIESSLVLTALKEFAEKHLEKHPRIMSGSRSESDIKSVPKIISNDEVKSFWSQFENVISNEKFKLWKSIEHGLNHYLVTLKEREDLDRQCEFLRRQNAELKHLLTRYLPENSMDSMKQK